MRELGSVRTANADADGLEAHPDPDRDRELRRDTHRATWSPDGTRRRTVDGHDQPDLPELGEEARRGAVGEAGLVHDRCLRRDS